MSLDTAPGITTRKTWLSICSQRRCTLCRIEVHIRNTCPSTDDPHNVRGDLDQPKTLNAQNTYPFTRHLLRVMIWPGGLVVPHTRYKKKLREKTTFHLFRASAPWSRSPAPRRAMLVPPSSCAPYHCEHWRARENFTRRVPYTEQLGVQGVKEGDKE